MKEKISLREKLKPYDICLCGHFRFEHDKLRKDCMFQDCNCKEFKLKSKGKKYHIE